MIDSLFDVSNQIVILTGVSGQLGNAFARSFLTRGAIVIGIDLIPPKQKAAISGLGKFAFFEADVTRTSSLRDVLSKIKSTFGTPTTLINCAAIDSPPSSPSNENGPFEIYPETSWDKILEVNLKGIYLCCQVFGSEMANAGRGSIINISSIYGMVSPDQSLYDYRRRNGETFFKPIAYSVSKSGILNLTRYLSTYWAKRCVRVNTLTLAGVFNNQDQEFLNVYCKRIPVGKMANPSDYCGAAIFLSSQASSYMTGANLIIDGGWTAI